MYAPLKWVLENWLRYNPFFIYANRDPLLHQTEVVARALITRPLRVFIADSIGLGKTIEAIRILSAVGRYKKLNYVLVAVPSTLVEQWIEELRLSGIRAELLDRARLSHLEHQPAIPPGWYVSSIDTLKKYLNAVKKVKWDAIVVDEAHRVGVPGQKPNQRWVFLAQLVVEGGGRDIILLLLSATPHRGKSHDYLLRLALLDPVLLELTGPSGEIERPFDNRDFYTNTHNTFFFRRTKDDVNNVYERKQVFKPCLMHAVVVAPSAEQKDFMELAEDLTMKYLGRYYDWYVNITQTSESSVKGVVSLLRAVLIKRALSSPESARRTFERIITMRSLLAKLIRSGETTLDKAREELMSKYSDKIKNMLEEDYMSGDVSDTETELDAQYDELAELYATFVDSEEALNKLERLSELTKKIEVREGVDRKFETLKKIIDIVVFSDPDVLKNIPDKDKYGDLATGKVVIFTEFKDTARYLERRLRKWLRERYGDDSLLRVLTSENKHELEDVVEWLKTSKKAVLVATDVGSEGLNLQYANVLVNYDIAWSPLRLEQRIGRLWRYGQQKTVYVFNLFLAHRYERSVSEVVYQKLYGMTQSIGKIDALLGEKVYYSALQSELLEKAVGEGTRLGDLIPLEVDDKQKLTEVTIINMIAEDAKAFVVYFMNALKKLLTQIRKNNIYPQAPDRKSIEEFLHSLTGFKNHDDVAAVVKQVAELTGVKWFELHKNPETALKNILPRLQGLDETRVFVYQSDVRELLVLTVGEVKVCRSGVCEVVYREPVAVVIKESDTIDILRGPELLNRLLEVLKSSIPVDESYGLDHILNAVAGTLTKRRAELGAVYHDRYFKEVVEHVKKFKKYEEKRLRLADAEGVKPYFYTDVAFSVEKDYAYVFIPTSLLPSVKTQLSGEVWFWLEDLALAHVEGYERAYGREPVVVKSAEHYDVRSVGSAEERFIEVKAPVSNRVSVALTESEFEVAKKYGGRYWLYIVLGADTDKPAILCVRNPVNKLKFVKEVRVEKQTRYVVEV